MTSARASWIFARQIACCGWEVIPRLRLCTICFSGRIYCGFIATMPPLPRCVAMRDLVLQTGSAWTRQKHNHEDGMDHGGHSSGRVEHGGVPAGDGLLSARRQAPCLAVQQEA